MTLYLGIDGGGTGCRAAVAGPEGRVLGEGVGAAANVHTDPEGARASILAAAASALRAAGRSEGLGALVAGLGIAGANLTGPAARLEAALPFARARVVSDAEIAARGALGAEDGIAAALGTGSVFAAQRGGRLRFLGGWGFLLGDQGSGAWLGRRLMEAALLAQDGLAARTPLLEAALAEAGGAEALVAWAAGARPADFARWAPRITAAAEAGDAAGAGLLGEAEAAVAAAIDALLVDGPVPVRFLGGLGPLYARRLAGRYGALVQPAKGTALDGALALARGLR